MKFQPGLLIGADEAWDDVGLALNLEQGDLRHVTMPITERNAENRIVVVAHNCNIEAPKSKEANLHSLLVSARVCICLHPSTAHCNWSAVLHKTACMIPYRGMRGIHHATIFDIGLKV